MPGELLACHLAYVGEERFFRADGRGVGVGRGRTTDSRIVRDVAEWSSGARGFVRRALKALPVPR